MHALFYIFLKGSWLVPQMSYICSFPKTWWNENAPAFTHLPRCIIHSPFAPKFILWRHVLSWRHTITWHDTITSRDVMTSYVTWRHAIGCMWCAGQTYSVALYHCSGADRQSHRHRRMSTNRTMFLDVWEVAICSVMCHDSLLWSLRQQLQSV